MNQIDVLATISIVLAHETLWIRSFKAQSSLAKLKKLDFVEQAEVGWRITDPIFCKWLVK